MNLPVEVIEAVNEGNCVLFVGSRASAESAELAQVDYPDNRALAKALGWKRPKQIMGMRAKRPPLPSVFAGSDLFEAASGRDALVDKLREATELAGVEPSAAYGTFLSRFPIVFTTCRDSLLQRAAEQMGGEPQVVYRNDPIPAWDLESRSIVKLWGGFESPETLVLTTKDVKDRPFDVDVRKSIRMLIRKKVVFFVGYRPDDEEFEALWGELTECYGGELPRCHLAVAQGKIDDYLWQKWVWRGLLMFTADATEAMDEAEKSIAS